MALIQIGNTVLPNPSTYNLQKSDLDGAGTTRSLSGVLHRDRIRAGVVKISVGWDNITYSDMNTICSSVEAASFSVSYFNGTSTLATATMYAGDKDIELIALNGSNITDSRWNVKFNLIQY